MIALRKIGKRPVRVIHAVLDLHEGGLERIVVELVRGAAATGVDARVVCLRRRGQLADELAPSQVAVVSDRGGLSGMLFPTELARTLRSLEADIVHAHSGVWFKAARAARLAGGLPLVITDHGRPVPDAVVGRLTDSIAARSAMAVVPVSAALGGYLELRLRVPRAILTVIPNGVEIPAPPDRSEVRAVRDRVAPGGAPLIGSVGRLDPIKAYDFLIASFAEVRRSWKSDPLPRLVLIGDGPDRDRLRSAAAQYGVADAVTFAGWQRDIQPWLHALDVFVLSSVSEGTSVSLLEAMGAERAVITTDVGGNADVLGDSLASQLVPSGDRPALVSRISDLLRDPTARALAAAAGRRRVTERYSRRAMLESYSALYSRLARD